jgi:hypothetical protein
LFYRSTGSESRCPTERNQLPRFPGLIRIVDRFEALNPYNRKLVPGSILRIHKLNWDSNKKRRQLFGYSIAAKRYALYTKADNDIEIVEPKAHGLGYFYPPKDSRGLKTWKP